MPDFEAYATEKAMLGPVADTWTEAFLRYFHPQNGDVSDLCFLDFGFGDGRYFDFFTQYLSPDHLYGVEVSRLRTARAQARGWHNATCVNPDEPLPFVDDYFHFINMVEVIEHLSSRLAQRSMSEISRVLRPDGVVMITTPNYPIKRVYDVTDAFRHGSWERLRDDSTHVTRYNHRRLKRLLLRYFGEVELTPYKTGFLYRRFPRTVFCHKIMAICRFPHRPCAPPTER